MLRVNILSILLYTIILLIPSTKKNSITIVQGNFHDKEDSLKVHDEHQYYASLRNSVAEQEQEGSFELGASNIFIINLPHRIHRREFMDNQMKALNLPYQFVDAVNFHGGNMTAVETETKRFHPATKMNVSMIEELLKVDTLRSVRNWGSAGCWQSHMQLYLQIAMEDGLYSKATGPFLLLEDDVALSPLIRTYLNKTFMEEQYPKDWEILLFDYDTVIYHPPVAVNTSHFIGHVLHSFYTDAYMIRSREVAKKLVEKGNTAEPQVADWILIKSYYRKYAITYRTAERFAFQLKRKFGTDVYKVPIRTPPQRSPMK